MCVPVSDPKYGCDPTLCSAAACPAIAAGSTLVCQSSKCVVGTCGAGTKNCAGQCVSTTDPAYGCGATTCDASSCASPGTGGTVVCQSGACVIGTCPTNFKKCGTKCVAVSDPAYGCGAATCDATTCPAAGTGSLICQGGACVIGSCGAGTKKCADKCVTTDANNGCADTARCAACASNEACMGSPTTCQCVPTPMATACNGKCGQVPNGCGGTYSCTMTCAPPQTCAGGGTPNMCGCPKTPMATACSGKTCGMASDGCGGMYTCAPGCSGSTPDCVSNKCVECDSDSTCNAKSYYACSNNACVCRKPNSATNILKDKNPGFDGSANPWILDGARWDASDADGCPKSGSIALQSTGSGAQPLFGYCLTSGFTAGRDYDFGYRFKGMGDGRCRVLGYSDTGCKAGLGDELELGVTSQGAWASGSGHGALISGVLSVYIDCTGGADGYYDQFFFTQSGTTQF